MPIALVVVSGECNNRLKGNQFRKSHIRPCSWGAVSWSIYPSIHLYTICDDKLVSCSLINKSIDWLLNVVFAPGQKAQFPKWDKIVNIDRKVASWDEQGNSYVWKIVKCCKIVTSFCACRSDHASTLASTSAATATEKFPRYWKLIGWRDSISNICTRQQQVPISKCQHF